MNSEDVLSTDQNNIGTQFTFNMEINITNIPNNFA